MCNGPTEEAIVCIGVKSLNADLFSTDVFSFELLLFF